jgi:small-conductance mechanosensitive channel
MEIWGIRFIGLNEENLRKLFLTIVIIIVVFLLRTILSGLSRLFIGNKRFEHIQFWTRQGISLLLAVMLILGSLSVWFNDPAQLTMVMGFISAGLAFALQKVVTSVAGYFVILRGRTFTVGDRIMMGGVRGDVIALSFTQTTIMEMGQPPGERPDDPNVWVKSRQYTGRIVTITNDKIFEEPVFNYSKDFPFIWEELTVGVRFNDRKRAEEIVYNIAKRNTSDVKEIAEESFKGLSKQYYEVDADFDPKIYYRIADSWLELTVRFASRDHGSRKLKDKMTREMLDEFDKVGISLPFNSFEVVTLPADDTKKA